MSSFPSKCFAGSYASASATGRVAVSWLTSCNRLRGDERSQIVVLRIRQEGKKNVGRGVGGLDMGGRASSHGSGRDTVAHRTGTIRSRRTDNAGPLQTIRLRPHRPTYKPT